jgi:hypothetical protein
LQPFPITEAPRIQSQDAAHLPPGISLRQSLFAPVNFPQIPVNRPLIARYAQDYALTVNRAVRLFGVKIHNLWITLHPAPVITRR